MNLASIVDPHPADRVALISRGETTTYGTLREQVAALRGGLAGLGLVPGDRLALAGRQQLVLRGVLPGRPGCRPGRRAAQPAGTRPRAAVRAGHAPARAPSWSPRPRPQAFADLDRDALPDLEIVIETVGVDLPGRGRARRPARRPIPSPIVDRERRRPRRAHVHQRHRRRTRGRRCSPTATCCANLEQVQAAGGRQQFEDEVVFGLLPMFHIFGLNVMLDLSLLRRLDGCC